MAQLQFYMSFRLEKLAKVFTVLTLVICSLIAGASIFFVGYVRGYFTGQGVQLKSDQKYLSQFVSATSKPKSVSPEKSPAPIIVYVTPAPQPVISWGGPQLWDVVNKARVENGVNPLKVAENLCTIASIRLNELLQLGTLDGHAGFSALEQRSDIKPIFDSYSDVSEFLVSGATSPQNAVDLWFNTLGHKELITGGQYVWGCIYAQDGFGVAISAY